MKLLSTSILSLLVCSPILSANPADKPAVKNHDFINFENDDTLHGQFLGFTTSGKIIWKNDSAEKNIAFDTKEVRKIVLNKGQETKPFTHISYATLKNLDTIPGKILSLTDEQLTLETDFGGKITIPKDQLLDISVNPIGDKILYRGPFSEDEPWVVKFPTHKTSMNNNLTEKENQDKKPWQIKNFSLVHQGSPSSMVMDVNLPEKYRITFNSYSSQSYFPTLTLMADLKIPEFDKDNKDLKQNRVRYGSSLANILGKSLVIRLHPSNPSITHFGFKEDGALFQTSITNMISGVSNRGIQGKIFYDVRVDKKAGTIMLYANKRHIGQWQIDSLEEQFKGTNYGFNMQYTNGSSKTVISDIVMSSWNGVRDSAISLENETRDIVMLNNGTDRYSGKITAIDSKNIDLKSAYADLAIPHDQVSTVNFARKINNEPETRAKNDVAVRFYGTGRITGILSKSDDGSVFLESKILGKIKIKSEFITSFEFTDMDFAYETL